METVMDDIKLEALRLAHDPNDSVSNVITRAKEYEQFLRGASDSEG